MNRPELISKLMEEGDTSKAKAESIVDLVFGSIAEYLIRGDRVEIRGLCSFNIKTYPDYVGRNPKTGEKVKVKPKKLPFFKPGKELRERVNKG